MQNYTYFRQIHKIIKSGRYNLPMNLHINISCIC